VIRHRPFGRGHPYRVEPDQRLPPQPIAGGSVELRATAPASVIGLDVVVEIDGRVQRLAASLVSDAQSASASGSGHLASAASRLTGLSRRAWSITLPALDAGAQLSYRFEAANGSQRTRTFHCAAASWGPAGGQLIVDGPAAGGRLIADSPAWLRADAGPVRVRFALRLEADAHVVGFGERFDRVDQRGQRLDATVFEQYKNQGNRTYLPVPFAIVIAGEPWGLHVRTSRRTWFDVGASEPDKLWVEVELDESEPEPLVELAIYGGSPAEILAAFLDEVGRPTLPPDWVFRPWMSANEWNTDARIRSEVERSLAEAIPVGVIVIEAWSDEATFAAFRDATYETHEDGSPHHLADFTFPPDGAWPDPRGLVAWLHERGVRVLLWQVPLLKTRPAPQGQARVDRHIMVERGLCVHEVDGRPYRNRGWWFPSALLPDWTNPEAKSWWLEKRRYLVEDVGIDGFKTDGGEHAWGHDLRYADGTRGDVTNNLYPVLSAAAYHELLRSTGRDPVTFSRAGFTGAGTYPLHWAGDENSTWEAFRASIIAGLTAGASGVFFWGWDLAGFSGVIPSAELYLRATAMATFCPIMQYHAEFNHHRLPSADRTPWNIAERSGDPRVVPTFRRFAELRERLLPYLISQARLAVERRLPLMRALFFDWPDDPEIWRHPYQYLLGDHLLIAPVVETGVERTHVYLPAGDWVDAWTEEHIRGPALVDRAVPLDEIPVYVRSSAIKDLLKAFTRGPAPT
jgi:alpha-glucosidase (family GH31 glycosyl hydrolase)